MLEVFIQVVNNITVGDLYIHSNDEQTFIIFKAGATIPCFKGSLVDCPTVLLDSLVYKFRGIDYNTIEVVLRWVNHSNKIFCPIGVTGRKSGKYEGLWSNGTI